LLAIGFAAVQVMPYLGQVLENQILSARKAEARRNPIEQLQNEVMRRAERLRAFRKALVSIGGQIESIEQMIEDRRYKDPGHVLARHQKALERLKQFQTVNMRRLQQASHALEEFRATVERKESEWRIALAIGDATEMMDPNATSNLMQDLLTDTALRSVQDRFNTVFAELDVQMLSVDSPTRDLLDGPQLDHIESLQLSEFQPQRRSA
jgi:translation initiation factor 2B subunit (eIF-2B alpha/beta/delta family)